MFEYTSVKKMGVKKLEYDIKYSITTKCTQRCLNNMFYNILTCFVSHYETRKSQ